MPQPLRGTTLRNTLARTSRLWCLPLIVLPPTTEQHGFQVPILNQRLVWAHGRDNCDEGSHGTLVVKYRSYLFELRKRRYNRRTALNENTSLRVSYAPKSRYAVLIGCDKFAGRHAPQVVSISLGPKRLDSFFFFDGLPEPKLKNSTKDYPAQRQQRN